MSPDLIKMAETILKSEYQITKTFTTLQRGCAIFIRVIENIICFEFRIWNIRICFEFRASNFKFTKNRLTRKICYFKSFSTKMT